MIYCKDCKYKGRKKKEGGFFCKAHKRIMYHSTCFFCNRYSYVNQGVKK